MTVESPSDPWADLDPVSSFRIFEGVNESTRPSQRLERFDVDVGVDIEFGAEAVELGLGKYARSSIQTARQLVSVVRPTIFAVTLI
jgi:hypothetical protein